MTDNISPDPKLLRVLVAVFEERNVSRAAEKLGLTQQGVSGALNRLRQVFNDRMFVRQGHGVEPTPRAIEAYPRALAAMRALSAVVETDELEPHRTNRVIRIAAAGYALETVVLPMFQQIVPLAPGLDFSVEMFRGAFDAADLREGGIDFAFTIRQFAPENTHMARLFSDRYRLVMRADHPLSQAEPSLDQFCAAEHLLVAPNKPEFWGVADTALKKLGRRRRIRLVTPSFTMAPLILQSTDLLALLPERLYENHSNGLVAFDPPFDLPQFEIMALWPDRMNEDKLHHWLREMVRVYVGDQ